MVHPSKKAGSSNTALQIYCLIKWVSGPYEGTYTHNVKIEWVQEYEPLSEESHFVKWQVPPKPKNGWPLYDGLVVETSVDLDYLKRRMEEEENSGSSSHEVFSPNSPAFKEAVASAVRAALEATPKSSQPPPVQSPPVQPQSPAQPESSEMVKIGTALWVKKSLYTYARACQQPSRVISLLLRQAFSRKRLTKSSYAGQGRTIGGVKKTPKPSLKKYTKMHDIEDFVKMKFPFLSQSTFCLTVGRYLGEKANSKPSQTYVDTSGSEEEDN